LQRSRVDFALLYASLIVIVERLDTGTLSSTQQTIQASDMPGRLSDVRVGAGVWREMVPFEGLSGEWTS
jgi:hypothetical protein